MKGKDYTIDLLVKVPCFVKKLNNLDNLAAIPLPPLNAQKGVTNM